MIERLRCWLFDHRWVRLSWVKHEPGWEYPVPYACAVCGAERVATGGLVDDPESEYAIRSRLDACKRLRRETGARVVDCRTALDIHDGDFEAARSWLRSRGNA